ncbi:hypothetical protein TWF730_010290 [Orbilia blumenaviensis]|uniref:RING-type domain-containing protein n=1 Tax=Orbilia blumenaviensis TaxID=1796055 RepID=A0AAV9URB2_9PEZI
MAGVIVISSSPSPEPIPVPPDAGNEPFDQDPGFYFRGVDEDGFIFPDREIQQEQAPPPEPEILSPDQCLATLLALFPDIDHAYVGQLYDQNVENVQLQGLNIVDFLADQILETGGHYPKLQREDRSTKRKRERSPSEMTVQELEDKYCNDPNRGLPSNAFRRISRKMLRNAFPLIPATWIDHEMCRTRFFVFGTFKVLAEAESQFDNNPKKPYKKLNRIRRAVSDAQINLDVNDMTPEEYAAFMEEFGAAKRIYEPITLKGSPDIEAGQAGSSNQELVECGCCFDEFPFAQMTQCSDGHLFCLGCGAQNAKTEIGQQRYKLLCMDASGCRKEFPEREIKRFCDDRMLSALEKFEQRDMIMKAGIEDLSECPFCEFAVIMPPIEEDKEFRCQNPDCQQVSCRLCNKPTHIPLTCEENAKDEKQNLRRGVEEAMTEALLRKCGKCSLPYVKDSGCNKIVCSRCNAMNCYLCSKVIKDYHHFNDPARGGKSGNCLLFDNTDERHHNEVHAAEEAAIAKIRAENPDITEGQMRIQLSQVVLDEERRKIDEGNRRLGNNAPVAGPQPARLNIVPGRFRIGRLAAPVPPPAPGPYEQRAAPPFQHMPQVINPMVPIPFQPMLQVPVVFPPDPGFQIGVPIYPPQMLRNPIIQIQNPVEYLANAVPFNGVPMGVPQPQPLNFFQRVVGMIPQRMGPQLRAAAPAVIPQPVPAAPLVGPNGGYNGVYQGFLGQYGLGEPNQPAQVQPQPQPQPQPHPQGQGNLGFLHRNFGGNRLVARGRQAARNRVDRVPQWEARPPPAPESPVRRPAKIAKRK